MQTHTIASDLDTLVQLNQVYLIDSVETSNAGRFREILADDFPLHPSQRCAARSQSVSGEHRESAAIHCLEAHDVNVRVMGDVAIVHARTTFTLADGTQGTGRIPTCGRNATDNGSRSPPMSPGNRTYTARCCAVAMLAVLGMLSPAAASAQTHGFEEFGGHVARTTLREFNGSDTGVGVRGGWRSTGMLGLEAELTVYPSNFPESILVHEVTERRFVRRDTGADARPGAPLRQSTCGLRDLRRGAGTDRLHRHLSAARSPARSRGVPRCSRSISAAVSNSPQPRNSSSASMSATAPFAIRARPSTRTAACARIRSSATTSASPRAPGCVSMRWLDAEDLYYLTVIGLIQLTAWSRSPRLSDTLANSVARIAWMLPTAKRQQVISRIGACIEASTPKQRREIGQRTYRAFWQMRSRWHPPFDRRTRNGYASSAWIACGRQWRTATARSCWTAASSGAVIWPGSSCTHTALPSSTSTRRTISRFLVPA